MLLRKNITISLLLLLMLLGIVGFSISCSDTNNTSITSPPVTSITSPPVINYKTFQMKPNDVRLKFLQHSLFSFEYPELFRLVDLNLMPEYPMVYGVSHVYFTIQQTDLPYQDLSIYIQKPGFAGYNDASDLFNEWISKAESNGDTIKTKQVILSGIQADYLETFGNKKEHVLDGTLIYPAHKGSFKGVAFDYAGLIWYISMTWDYHGSEPPEMKTYFEHVIETFKILD